MRAQGSSSAVATISSAPPSASTSNASGMLVSFFFLSSPAGFFSGLLFRAPRGDEEAFLGGLAEFDSLVGFFLLLLFFFFGALTRPGASKKAPAFSMRARVFCRRCCAAGERSSSGFLLVVGMLLALALGRREVVERRGCAAAAEGHAKVGEQRDGGDYAQKD